MLHVRDAAFTLMELMISMALLSMVMVIVTMSLDTSSRFNDRFSRQTDINNRANDILNKLAMQLRMANPDKTALELPGPYPLDFKPKNPSKSANVVAYYFSVGTGIGDSSTDFAPQFEPYKRAIIYDYSVVPGRIVLQTRDADGKVQPEQTLSEDIAENGFSLTRIGNTLQMSLTLRSQTRVEEEIIYTALAQTLFLRATLNKSSGTASMLKMVNPQNEDGDPISFTPGGPNIMFGNLVTVLSTDEDQVSAFISAPIGKKINPQSITVEIATQYGTTGQVVVKEGETASIGNITLTRSTYPPPTQWPSRNGTYSVSLTGKIGQSVVVYVRAQTTDGEQFELPKKFK